MLVERVGTLGYFIPTLLKLLQPDRLSQKKAEDAARHWIRLNHIRSVFAFAQRPHCGATVATPELLHYMKGLGAGAFPNGCS